MRNKWTNKIGQWKVVYPALNVCQFDWCPFILKLAASAQLINIDLLCGLIKHELAVPPDRSKMTYRAQLMITLSILGYFFFVSVGLPNSSRTCSGQSSVITLVGVFNALPSPSPPPLDIITANTLYNVLFAFVRSFVCYWFAKQV